MRRLSLIGQRFGRLKVVAEYAPTKFGNTAFVCECDCGEQLITAGVRLKNGIVRSCGCLRRESQQKNKLKCGEDNLSFIHGHFVGGHGSPTYMCWIFMKSVCTNPQNPSFHLYGARGITVCDRWMSSFEAFLADVGEKPEGARMCRLDKNRGFEPNNCEWKLIKRRGSKKLTVAGAEVIHEKKPPDEYEWRQFDKPE